MRGETQQEVAVEAAVTLVIGLDGTYGQTWKQVADRLDAQDRQVPAYVDARALADLIRALDAYGAI